LFFSENKTKMALPAKLWASKGPVRESYQQIARAPSGGHREQPAHWEC
jgi:hypothetical protein